MKKLVVIKGFKMSKDDNKATLGNNNAELEGDFTEKSGYINITLDDINNPKGSETNKGILLARAMLSLKYAQTLFEEQNKVKLSKALFVSLCESDQDISNDDNLCANMINHVTRIIDENPDMALSKDMYDEVQDTYRDMVEKGHQKSIKAAKQLQIYVDDILDHKVSGMVGILEDSITPELFDDDQLSSFSGKLLVFAELPQDQGKKHRYQARAIKAVQKATKAKIMHTGNDVTEKDKNLYGLLILLDNIKGDIPANIQKEMELDLE